IKIQALRFTPQGCNREFKKYSGYVARIFQHEIDHLDGKLFLDHIKNPDHLHWVEKKEFPLYRDREAWRNWPKKYSLPLA
ncbi:MAG: peptide deformylase, partial [Candidatus Daviesbacteria bacterium]|nr:peptide deformylase [Candidatus Daviesbacteria bacterium]